MVLHSRRPQIPAVFLSPAQTAMQEFTRSMRVDARMAGKLAVHGLEVSGFAEKESDVWAFISTQGKPAFVLPNSASMFKSLLWEESLVYLSQ